ncbi:hypothetical protein ACX80Z_15345 [Arthrobacter sp. TMT4-20]
MFIDGFGKISDKWRRIRQNPNRENVQTGPRDLQELRHANIDEHSWFVNLIQPEIGGGRLTVDQFSEIYANPGATAIRVSGLNQKTFELLVSEYGTQFTAIEFWKCPTLVDLTPLEDLSELQMVSFFWNQKATRLWNLARTPVLAALQVQDFNRLKKLDDLGDGHALRELVISDGMWPKMELETLEPLGALAGLRSLQLYPKRIDDGRVQPLGSLTGLEKLSIPTNLFTTEQIAWLKARLPDKVESEALAALNILKRPFEREGKSLDVLLVGKRKPFLNSELDAARISRHVNKFDQMLTNFEEDPSLEPD